METGKSNTKDFNKPTLSIFLEYFKPHMGLFVLDLTCALIASAVDLVFPLVARHAMYHMLPDKAFAAFFHVMIIVGIAFLLKAIMHYIITYWGHMFGVRVEADLRDDLFAHMQSLDFNFFNKNRTGQLLSRMTGDLFEVTEMAHHGPEDLFIASITIVGAVIIMFTIQWKLALVILILLPIALTVVMLNRRRMIRTSRKVKEKLAEINGEVESGLSGVRTSKAFANEAEDYAKFAAANDEFRTAKCENYKAFGLFASSLEFFMSIMPVVIMAVGGWIIMRNEMNYADLITFYLYIATFITPIRKLAGFMETFMNGWAGLTRFVEIMRLEPEVDVAPGTGKPLTAYDIDIDNISFAYQEKNTDVINGVSLRVKEGETVAIVGPSGGGKTTLCQLIPRFYDVDEGAIRIGGTDIREIEKRTLRKNIGIVQQDVFLFADTIAENIRYGRPDATDEEVIAAAKKAEIYEDVMAMPDGFASYTGERGVLLSGGQKQRVSIARIFLKNPPILILDEATSALDTVTEARIQGAFDKLAEGRTTIIIAHRLSTIRNADRIVLIDDGEIKEEGTHEDLMKIGGQYASLYKV
ncbi:MAG: ABC transporter ATP-binding protein/permease [Clostridia bacterium]|nr:ABC transporter ATP-binding protein/permease [Clostridia bacterium]